MSDSMSAIAQLIGGMTQNILGDPIFIGLFIFFIFILGTAVQRVKFESAITYLLPLLFIEAQFGLMPEFIGWLSAFGCSILIFMAFKKLMGR